MKNNDYEPSRPVRRVIEELTFARLISPGHFQAPCPLNSDHTISIVEGTDGRAILECSDGDWLSEIVPALELTVEDLFECIDDIYLGSPAPAYPPPMRRAS